MQLAIELILAPALVALTTVAARRWGPGVGGLLSAFPAIVGPVLLIDALDHGSLFTARAANGTLLGLAALSAFALAYARCAGRWGWWPSLLAGWAAALVATTAVGLVTRGAGSPVGLLLAVVSLALAYLGMPRAAVGGRPTTPVATVTGRPTTPVATTNGSIRLRMALTALLVSSLAAAASGLGPVIGGMLAALPVLASILAVFTHRESDSAAVVALLRGMLAGMAGFVAFCQVLLMLIVLNGTLPAFVAATAAAVIAQAVAFHAQSGGHERYERIPARASRRGYAGIWQEINRR